MTPRPFDIKAVVESLLHHFRAKVRHPQLGRVVQGEYPALTLAQFNQAAEAAWHQLSDKEREREVIEQ